MQGQNPLPQGFLSFDEALKLIQSDTQEHPVVNVDRLTRNIKWLEAKHNFTIFLIKRDPETGRIVENGNRPVQIANDYEATTMEHAILAKYEELMRQKYDTNKVKKISTMVTDDENGGNMQAMPVENKASTTKYGDDLPNA